MALSCFLDLVIAMATPLQIAGAIIFNVLAAAPPSTAAYSGLEDHLRKVTANAKRESLPSPQMNIGNYATSDNLQSVTGKLEHVGNPPVRRVRLISSLGSERIPYLVKGNLTRAYFSGAAVTSGDGGPWAPFETDPPIYPQSVQPDLAIGPPPEMYGRQKAFWDVIPFNTRSGEQQAIFEYFNVDAACRAGGYKLTLVEPPQHGSVQIGETEFFQPAFILAAFRTDRAGQPDTRGRCRPVSFPAGAVVYTSAEGYIGQDTATVVIEDHGLEVMEHFTFRVVPR